MKVAIGYDRHVLVESEGSSLAVAGVRIPCGLRADAHSDGDVVYHAVADAILSVFLHSDIGKVFGEDRPEYRGCDSSVFVAKAFEMAGRPKVANIDVIVMAERPSVARYTDVMRENVAGLLDMSADDVSVRGRHREAGDANPAVECLVSILFG